MISYPSPIHYYYKLSYYFSRKRFYLCKILFMCFYNFISHMTYNIFLYFITRNKKNRGIDEMYEKMEYVR